MVLSKVLPYSPLPCLAAGLVSHHAACLVLHDMPHNVVPAPPRSEHAIMALKYGIDFAIPDVPPDVVERMERQRFQQ